MVSFAHDETARALWRAVLAEPANGLSKMVLADRCDELGLREATGYTLRWAGTHGHHPIIHPPTGRERRPWVYWCPRLSPLRRLGPEELPAVVFDHLPPVRSRRMTWACRSEWEAFLALADALVDLRRTVAY